MIIAATGHRPNRLGGYGPDVLGRLVQIATEYLTDVHPDTVISGMAIGWDTAVALAALSCGYSLTAAVPCEGQERMWPAESQEMYRNVLAAANRVITVTPGPYEPYKMHLRDRWMVDRCDLLVALWNGDNGGTAGTVNYAIKCGRPWVNLWSRFSGG